MAVVPALKSALDLVVEGLVLLADASAKDEPTPLEEVDRLVKDLNGPKGPLASAPAIFLALLITPHVFASGFSVIGTDPGPWPKILTSVGHFSSPAVESKIFVGRPGAPASPNWNAKLQQGCILVIEGESSLAGSFGFHPTAQTVQVASIRDVHRPGLPIVFEKPLEIHRFEIPTDARVFARDRWTDTPVIAGIQRGPGAVLWIAASPGDSGYERFPYLLQAMLDLGVQAPFESRRLWAFFDSSYRSRVDLDYFAERWRKSGIGALQVAAWHFWEPDAERDDYLGKLVEACHKQAITVYAWIELPHVSEKFWADHPQWREKTGVLQDAQLDWRKLMNLQNPECVQAVRTGLEGLMRRFDWDGINLSELYFESLEGAANPARFTPMNDDVRAEFRETKGWDPVDLFSTRKDGASLRAFLDFRADLAKKLQEEWMGQAEAYRAFRPDLDIVLTHVDDRFDQGMKDAIGADAGRVLPMLKQRDFTFLVEDPATVWNLGPQRYPEIARRYAPINPKPERLAIDINVVDRYQDVYPTKQQTGTELFELVHLAASSFSRVALYFENSILSPDLGLLPSAAAQVQKVERVGGKTVVSSPYGVGVPWTGPIAVDGRAWPAASDQIAWIPAGTHTVEAGARTAGPRLLDFSGTLKAAEANGLRLEIGYESSTRTIAIVDRRPSHVAVDGAAVAVASTSIEGGRFAVLLPRGSHNAQIETE